MKKLGVFLVLAVVIAALALVGGGSGLSVGAQGTETAVQPTVTVWPPVVKLHSSTNVVIMGSGFKPGQELAILLPAADQNISSILDNVDPKPAPGQGLLVDERGTIACLFTIGRLERLEAEGIFSIAITDLDYKILASAPIGFADPDGRSRVGIYPRGKPDYEKNPDDPRPLPWCEPFFEYPERP